MRQPFLCTSERLAFALEAVSGAVSRMSQQPVSSSQQQQQQREGPGAAPPQPPSGLAGGGGKRGPPTTTILIYPTVAPETVVIPIVSCILGFPLLALLVICCLRRRAQLARERDRRRAAGSCEFSDHRGLSLVRLSPVHQPGRGSRSGSGAGLHRSGHRSGIMGAWGEGGRGSEGGDSPRRDVEQCGVAALVGGVLFLDTVVEERSEAEVDAELTTTTFEVNMPSPTDDDDDEEDSGCYQGDRGEYDSKSKKDYRHFR